ncbi:carboxylesterase/lipase family protein [Brevundimonas sp. Root1423]|uniref:carboxylesterase/lipase family protein n=1 Tax=Brevundimonas sp. Root1423 TaxID=1736462 RepID=UPI0006F284C1|nr:carboxylesterase family protein [Brevundimonas sp. Root1423]KQY91737.1 carboxylesterase [Brevundimonas sp. Root1423]
MSLVFFLAAALIMTPGRTTTPDPRAVVEQGVLIGRAEDGVSSFRGVPYAAAPVGPLRWRAPQAATSWEGQRDAGQVGAICIQPPANGDPGVGPLPMSEDCLTLNVWTPVERAGPRPVMVWIHGGGFNNGSGTAALYDGANLARRGVIVVTVNYRLGRLGFFDHPALAAERARGEPGGNYGMMDIVAALEWVRDNAAAFGGDAGNVTVFGESAGGAAVTRLMISPQARGLFHRAVVQSGLGRDSGVPLDAPSAIGGPSLQDRGVGFAQSVGATTAAQLRAVPAEALLRPAPNFYGGDNLVIDGQVVTEDVEAAFAAGREAPVPMIIGTNSAEFWWIRPSEISPYGAIDDALTSQERVDLYAAYGGEDGYRAHVVSDLAFNEPARHLARLHARNGHPTYLYRFDVVPDSNPEPSGGATHASERPYVFDNLHTVGRPMAERDDRAATAMADYWTRFATTGDPNEAGRPVWPEFGAQRDRLLEFTNDGPEAKPIPFADRLDLIEAYYARIR